MARKKKTKVFVSYSRHDEALVRPLAGLLGVAAEDAVFLDVEQLRPGDVWEEKLVGAVREASVFVLCWCCESRRSEFVAKEIGLALEDGRKRLVPVLFCEAKLPEALRSRQWIDLRGKVVHVCACAVEADRDSVEVPLPEMPVKPEFEAEEAQRAVFREELERVQQVAQQRAQASRGGSKNEAREATNERFREVSERTRQVAASRVSAAPASGAKQAPRRLRGGGRLVAASVAFVLVLAAILFFMRNERSPAEGSVGKGAGSDGRLILLATEPNLEPLAVGVGLVTLFVVAGAIVGVWTRGRTAALGGGAGRTAPLGDVDLIAARARVYFEGLRRG